VQKSKLRVVVLDAGFGGLEIATFLSERIGDRLDLTLIDKSDSFYFGYSKLDVMSGTGQPRRDCLKQGMSSTLSVEHRRFGNSCLPLKGGMP
jgi:NADH dehydrogenase FAD-containing subunit